MLLRKEKVALRPDSPVSVTNRTCATEQLSGAPESQNCSVVGKLSVRGKCRNIIDACPDQFFRGEMASLSSEAEQAFTAVFSTRGVSRFRYPVRVEKERFAY